jgi:hypothetical protein
MLQFLKEYPLLDVLRVGLDTFQKPYFGSPTWVLIVFHHVRYINAKVMMDNDCVADPDPGSGAFLTPGSELRDGKKVSIGIRICNTG